MLHEPQLVVEMCSGAGALFPSATFFHENIPIAEDETRQSIVLYSSGGLFRWRAYGFRSWEQFGIDDIAARAKFATETTLRWANAWAQSFSIPSLDSYWS